MRETNGQHSGAGRPARIVMVSANAFPVMGGVETHIHEVAPRVAHDGFDVTVLTTDRSGGLPQRAEEDGVHIRRVRAMPARRDYYFAPDVYRRILGGDYDLVHCQGYHTLVSPMAMWAAMRARIPFVLSFHSGGHGSELRTRLRIVQHLALRPLLVRAARLIAVSEFEAEFFSQRLRIRRDRFEIIPNGAELGSPGPERQRPARQDPSTSLILSVGRLERHKGHQRAIAALPHLLRHLPGARLRIVGAGPYEAELRRLARMSGVADRIEIGPIDAADRAAMAELMSRAALVVLLSEYESQGIAALEALALRRPVLVADTTALSELARRGLARAVAIDSSDQDTALAMLDQIQSATLPVFELPSWDSCAVRLASLYREVLAR